MRFAVNEAAKRFAITGYVENLEDGRVRIVAEGEPSVLSEFLELLPTIAPGSIRRCERYDCEASGEFPNFSVQR